MKAAYSSLELLGSIYNIGRTLRIFSLAALSGRAFSNWQPALVFTAKYSQRLGGQWEQRELSVP
jgi:hypothetical protein